MGFYMGRVYEIVVNLDTKVNKCSYINEDINFFRNIGQDYSLTFNQ